MNTAPYRETLLEACSVAFRAGDIPHAALPHIHDAYEIMLILSEGVSCRIAQEVVPVPCGSLLLFNHTDLHGLTAAADSRAERYVLYFQPMFVAHLSTLPTQLLECFSYRPARHPQVLPLGAAQCARVRTLLDALLHTHQEPPQAYGHDLQLQLQLASLLICVNAYYRAYHRLNGPPPELARFYEIVRFIPAHLDEKLTLSSLSAQFFLSPRELSRRMHSALGMSLGEYVTQCRIAQATDALAQGMRVQEVCARVGFENLSHFSRTFKAHTGLSPKQYAQRRREGQGV